MSSFRIAAANSAALRYAPFHIRSRRPPPGRGLGVAKPGVGLGDDRAEAAGCRTRRDAIGFDEHDVQSAGSQHVRGCRAGQSAADDDHIRGVAAFEFGMGAAPIRCGSFGPVARSVAWHAQEQDIVEVQGFRSGGTSYEAREGSRCERESARLVGVLATCDRAATSSAGFLAQYSSDVCASATDPGPARTGAPQLLRNGMSVVNANTAVQAGHRGQSHRRHDQHVSARTRYPTRASISGRRFRVIADGPEHQFGVGLRRNHVGRHAALDQPDAVVRLAEHGIRRP